MICTAEYDIEQLIDEHLWVLRTALSRLAGWPVTATSEPDLWQDGLIELWRAAQSYDPVIGAFSTIAWKYVVNGYRHGRRRLGMARKQYETSSIVLGSLVDRSQPVDPLASETVELIESMLAMLPPIEADIIRRHYGLNGTMDESQREIGESYGVSGNHIGRIERQGLARLRRRVANDPKLDRALRDC